MSSNSPKREPTPSIPMKRALEDDHQPAVSSPLNPDFSQTLVRERAARSKKESLKKRESKSERATPDPKPKPKVASGSTQATLRYKLPPPMASDFVCPEGPALIPTDETISGIELYKTSEHVHNKKTFRYTHCIADPAFKSSQYYRQTETEPFRARVSFEDSSEDILFDESGQVVITGKGWRMARANVCARSGRWYYECKILKGVPKRPRSEALDKGSHKGPCVRMGWARREASLEMSVGADAYSYGLRDVGGQKVHMARPKDFFPDGEEIQDGDVIGFEINLPSEQLHHKVVTGNYNPAVDLEDDETGIEVTDVIRDRIPIRFKSNLYFEQVDYHPTKELNDLKDPTPVIASAGGIVGAASQELGPTNPTAALRTLPHSYIRVYKNGKDMGKPFENLLAFLPPASKPSTQAMAREGLDDGMLGYFPVISVLRGSSAKFNLGPEFDFPPPGYEDHDDEVDMVGSDQPPPQKTNKVRAISERFNEQIAEDIMYDVVDEVCNFMEDLQKGAQDVTASLPGVSKESGQGTLSNVVFESEQIKELVQDEE